MTLGALRWAMALAVIMDRMAVRANNLLGRIIFVMYATNLRHRRLAGYLFTTTFSPDRPYPITKFNGLIVVFSPFDVLISEVISITDMKSMPEDKFIDDINRNIGIIHKICNVYFTGPDDRKDAYQEILYQLWKSYPGFKGDAKFSTWMY